MRYRLLLLGGLGLACGGPELDVPKKPAVLVVELEPAASVAGDRVPLLFRGKLQRAPSNGEPWLFRGELSDYYERALRRGELPEALRERAVPLRFWRSGADCWLEPSVWLEPGATYSLGFTLLGTLKVLQAQAELALRATRLFPPAGQPKRGVSVECGLPNATSESRAELTPSGATLGIAPGIAGEPAAGCATFTLEQELTQPNLGPLAWGGALLDPAPWAPVTKALLGAPDCAYEPLPGACLEIEDDRLFVTPRGDDQLWLLASPQARLVAVSGGVRSELLRGLAPQSAITLVGKLLSSTGQMQPVSLRFSTTAEHRHLVLNEVLANPLGAEEAGEWIELVNDADRPASLANTWLEDASGSVPLPDVTLQPNEIVLLVGEAFGAAGADVAPAPETRVLRLPQLGSRGLSNTGEALLLVGPEGILSRFPALPASHAGRSWARRSVDAADDDPSAFAEHAKPGASPGASNSFE